MTRRWSELSVAAACVAASVVVQGCGCDASSATGSTDGALVQNQSGPRFVAAGQTRVFWSSDADGAIRAVPKAGGDVTVVAPASASPPVALAADGDSVFWATADTVFAADGAGAAPRVVAGGLSAVRAVAVDATNVYWADAGTGSVAAMARSGGAPVVLVTGASLAGGLAVDRGTVYWGSGSAVVSMPASGGAATTVAPASAPVVSIVATGGHVAWLEAGPSGATLRLPDGKGSSRAFGATEYGALAAGSQGVFVFATGGALQLLTWDGSTRTDLGGDDDVGALAAGESTLYYSAPRAGEIRQVLEQ